jgi:hypothetical protein
MVLQSVALGAISPGVNPSTLYVLLFLLATVPVTALVALFTLPPDLLHHLKTHLIAILFLSSGLCFGVLWLVRELGGTVSTDRQREHLQDLWSRLTGDPGTREEVKVEVLSDRDRKKDT